MWWGLSPALDLTEECKDLNVAHHTNEGVHDSAHRVYNILLVGQCDARHVLKTIAQAYRHEEKLELHFYLYEPLLENVAKQLLFFTLALEPPENLGLLEKANLFMELYGNTMIRPKTAEYLDKISQRLLHITSNLNYAEKILPSVSLDSLKYKERDQLETIFKFWAAQDDLFKVLELWEARVRTFLGPRYDTRSGVYDWDYYMRYKPYGGDVINYNEYKHFRESGVGFQFEETNPCVPNRTLASAIYSSGSKISSYGYLGDILTGPFVTFGLTCDDAEMLRKINGMQTRKSRDLTERNLMRLFYELEHQEPFIVETEEVNGVVVPKMDEKYTVMPNEKAPLKKRGSRAKVKVGCEEYRSLSMGLTDIVFLPASNFSDLTKKLQYQNFFDLLSIPHNLVLKCINTDAMALLKENAKIVVDTPRYVLDNRKEDLEKYKTDLNELMKECNCDLQGGYDHLKDNFVRYKVVK